MGRISPWEGRGHSGDADARDQRRRAVTERAGEVLRRHRTADADPVAEARSRIPELFSSEFIRPPDAFRPPRSHDASRITLGLARHLFARYPVPTHLEAVWSEAPATGDALGHQLGVIWAYVTVAGGGSIHREHLRGILSRRECHAYLVARGVRDHAQALWYAVARGHTSDHGRALQVSSSKLSHRSRSPGSAFWRDACRFLVLNPMRHVHQVDDVLDYLTHRRNADPAFAMAGRTAASVLRGMEAWHRELARSRRMGTAAWTPAPWVDHAMERDGMPYLVTQVTNGRALAAEGTALRHCVVSYLDRCVAGATSIHSLRDPEARPLLTIEVDDGTATVVQVRGFANRRASSWETALVGEWMRVNGLVAGWRAW